MTLNNFFTHLPPKADFLADTLPTRAPGFSGDMCRMGDLATGEGTIAIVVFRTADCILYLHPGGGGRGSRGHVPPSDQGASRARGALRRQLAAEGLRWHLSTQTGPTGLGRTPYVLRRATFLSIRAPHRFFRSLVGL